MDESMCKLTARTVAIAAGMLLSTALLLSACEFPITEPEDRPATIWNSLDQAVDIYMVADAESAPRSFVVSIPPGETYMWEGPTADRGCVDGDLIAVIDGRDIDRLSAYTRYLCENDDWGVRDRSASTTDP